MKNRIITVYELIGFMKDNKAPKKIKIYDEEFELIENHYYLGGTFAPSNDLYYKIARGYATLNDTVEILEEKEEDKRKLPHLFSYWIGRLGAYEDVLDFVNKGDKND